MKIAVPVEDGMVNSHFGHTKEFMFYYIEDNKIVKKEQHQAPEHKPGVIPRYLYLLGVNQILATKIGDSAKRILDSLNVEYTVGVKGDATDNVEAFLSGYLEVSDEVSCCSKEGEHSCDHKHEEGHSCCGHSSEDEECHGEGKKKGCCSHH